MNGGDIGSSSSFSPFSFVTIDPSLRVITPSPNLPPYSSLPL